MAGEAPGGRGEGRRIAVTGTVQGVGFRPFVYRIARETGVAGRVRNDAAGVTIDAFGTAAALDRFVARLRADPPPAAVVAELTEASIPGEVVRGFEIVESGGTAERRAAIPPDLATCEACLAEVRDPRDRRHRYPFTNCTACGPRFTIALGAPYDRPATTMAGFRMCAACAAEYGDPADRRFHAQPNACPECGPRVALRDRAGAAIAGVADPLAALGAALAGGAVAAVKGIGGYHLACDATSSAAVRTLRERKRREEKPLAVMARDLEEARALAELAPAEEALLVSVERPIVLCRRRAGAGLAPEIAPGSPLVGLVLPYSPLHHLLLAAAGRPLVMTSGNLSDEPIAFEDDEAIRRLGGIADLFLVHDRPIASACDDSVARVVAGRPLVLRRARGFVPRPVRLARRFRRPVLGVGAQLKNACCVVRGDEAVLGPHVGDLDGLETYGAFEAAVARLEAFLAVRPEAIACDLHPLYLSTRWARERAAALGVPLVEVQHHHAHAAAALAEHGLDGPALALAWDGVGLGTDGAAWGGELLLVERGRFERLATFRPLRLAGGDRAVTRAVARRPRGARRRARPRGPARRAAALRPGGREGARGGPADARGGGEQPAGARLRARLRRGRGPRARPPELALRGAGRARARRGGRGRPGGALPVRRGLLERAGAARPPRHLARPRRGRPRRRPRRRRVRPLPRDARRRRGGARPPRPAPDRPAAGRPDGRLLPERPARRGAPRRAFGHRCCIPARPGSPR